MTAPSWDPKELSRLRESFQQLERELKSLEFRLRQFEHVAAQALAPPLPEMPGEPVTVPAPAAGEFTAVPLAAAGAAAAATIQPAGETPARQVEPYELAAATVQPHPYKKYLEPLGGAGSGRASKGAPARDWEATIGGRWMTWIGAFVLLLALGFTVHWAVNTFETPKWLQVLAFHLLGAGLLVGGHLLNRRGVPLGARALAGLGVFTLYTSAFAALHLYKLWSPETAFIECTLITILAVGVALAADSAAVVMLGALGGYLTPILTSTGSANYVGLFSYLAFLNVALVASAVWRGWGWVKPIALAATAMMFALWIFDGLQPADSRMVWGTEWFAALHAAIFLIGSTIPPVAWKRPSTVADVMALSGASLLFVGTTWILFHDRPEQQMALVCWGMSLLHAVLFGVTFARVTNVDRMPRTHLALATVLFTLAIPLQLDDANLYGLTWCIEGLVFTAVGAYFRDRQMCVTAVVVFCLAAVRLLGWDFGSPPRPLQALDLDARFLLIAISGLLAIAAGSLYRLIPRWPGAGRLSERDESILSGFLLGGGNILLLLSMMCQWDSWSQTRSLVKGIPLLVSHYHWDSRLVLALWVLDVALIWAIAFRRDMVAARWYALALAILFVGGRAFVQGDDLSGAYQLLFNARFGALALVAALYFGAGWMYRRRLTAEERGSPLGDLLGAGPRDLNEALLDPMLGILANVVLVVAMSLEIDSWYAAAAARGYTPFPNMRMAELATYSIVWAIYAAAMVAAGFVLRYPLFRMLGLIAFGPILLKVFFIDLASLEWLPRILALAVLGVMLMGVSMLYQKFAARVQSSA